MQKVETAKHVAQDMWEMISGHPTNIGPRPIKQRSNSPVQGYTHEQIEDPTVVAAHAKKKKARDSFERAEEAEKRAKKNGDSFELQQAKDKRGRRQQALEVARDEELEALLAANKAKRLARGAEKGKSGGGETQKQKINFEKQTAPSGKMPKGESDGVESAKTVRRDGDDEETGGNASSTGPAQSDLGRSAGKVASMTSKAGSELSDKTIASAASEFGRQLGDNERSFVEGMIGSSASISSKQPSGSVASSGSRAPASKPLGGSQAKNSVPPDAPILQEKTEFNRPIGNMDRTQLEGMQNPSVVAGWNHSSSSTRRPSSARPLASKAPSKSQAKGPLPPADATILPGKTDFNRPIGNMDRTQLEGMQDPSVVAGWRHGSSGQSASRNSSARPLASRPSDATIKQEKSEFNRPIGNMDRTQLEGMQNPSVVAGWHHANSAPPSGKPASVRPLASLPPKSRPLASKAPSTSAPKSAAPSTAIPQVQTEMNRAMGDMNRTFIDGMQGATEIASWNQTRAENTSSRTPASRALASRPVSLASITPQTAFHHPRQLASIKPKNPTIPQVATDMKRQIGNNDRTFVEGIGAGATYLHYPTEYRDVTILPDAKSEYLRPLGNMERTVVEGMVPGSQYGKLKKAEKKENKKGK